MFDPNGKFLERVDADDAEMGDGEWRLNHVIMTAPGVEPRRADVYHLRTNLLPSQVVQSFMTPESVPFWSLPRVVDDTEGAGLDAVGYRLRFQSLLALPALLAAMVLIAASFSLKLSRMGGVGVLVLGGVGAGFVLYVASKLVSDLGGAGVLSAPVAAWSPGSRSEYVGRADTFESRGRLMKARFPSRQSRRAALRRGFSAAGAAAPARGFCARFALGVFSAVATGLVMFVGIPASLRAASAQTLNDRFAGARRQEGADGRRGQQRRL